MLQNRVDPWGNLIKTSARGSFMGNRGVLHDEHRQIQKNFRLKAWITCVLQFKGRHRKIMSPNRWTELFFLDEATAFAAGHRPCFECRREDAKRFKTFWLQGNPEYGFDEKTSINEIDTILHQERINKKNEKVSYEEKIDDLPDGSFVEWKGVAYLKAKDDLHPWTPFGYDKNITLPKDQIVSVLTPRSIVNALEAGYFNDRSTAIPFAETLSRSDSPAPSAALPS